MKASEPASVATATVESQALEHRRIRIADCGESEQCHGYVIDQPDAPAQAEDVCRLPISAKVKRPAHPMTYWALYSGDVLLSHGLSPYYHRGCSVSLPCSEWERVVPLR